MQARTPKNPTHPFGQKRSSAPALYPVWLPSDFLSARCPRGLVLAGQLVPSMRSSGLCKLESSSDNSLTDRKHCLLDAHRDTLPSLALECEQEFREGYPSMLPITLGLCLLVVAVAFVFLRTRPKIAPSRRAPAPQHQPFAAVDLVPGTTSCAHAKSLSLQPMLADDAPALPLDGCTEQCRCRFKKVYADRRQINRRRGDDGLSEDFIYAGPENRSGDSRRS